MAKKALQKAVGLMSGTSADGADAALIATDGENAIEFFGGITLPYDSDLRARVLEASQHDVPILELARVERDITIHHAKAVVGTREDAAPRIARHVAHRLSRPHGAARRRRANHLADWQSVAIGRQDGHAGRLRFPPKRHGAGRARARHSCGMFHRALWSNEKKPTVVLNIGGVANITWLGENDEIIAGDTGPGCGLLDEWIEEMAGMPHDEDGRIAQQGRVHGEIVDAALATPFFSKPLPRSADRFDFDHVDVSGLSVEDGAATLCAVTVQAIVKAVRQMRQKPATLWVTGGGVHHPVIMRMLAENFEKVRSVRELNT